MRRMVLAALAVLALGMLAACGNDDDVSISTPEGDVSVNTDNGQVDITGNSGEGSVQFGSGELPEDFPEDFPLPDDFQVTFSGSGSDVGEGDYGAYVTGTTEESVNDLKDFYDSELPDAGYDVQGSASSDFQGTEGASISFEGNGISGAVIIGAGVPIPGQDSGDGGTSLSIGYGSSSNSSTTN